MANEEVNKEKTMPMKKLLRIEGKENFKTALVKSGTQIGVTVVGGALGTVLLGKWSFLTGLSLVGLGNLKGISWLAPLGTGMMASALFLPAEPPSTGPFSMSTETAKVIKRADDLKENFLSATYLNKIFTSRANAGTGSGSSTKSTQREISSGEENAQAAVNGIDAPAESDLEKLNKIEQQLVASAMEYQRNQKAQQAVQGVDPELMGLESEVDFSSM